MSGSESSSDSKVEKNKPKLNTIIRQLHKALVELTQCPIDAVPYSEKNPPVFSTSCGHTFGKDAASKVTECPFCREPIAKIETNYAIKGMLEICEKLKSAIRIKLQELENSKDQEVEITGLRQEIEYLMEKLKQKGIEIEKLNSLLSETKDAMQQEIDILKLDNQKLRAILRNSQNINADLTKQLAEAKQQVTLEKPKPNKPSEESSEGFDAKHLLSGPRERKGKGKKSKGNLSVSESPEQRAAAHDAKPLPAKVESVLPREKEAKAAGRGPNWFKVVTAGILSVVSVVSFVEGAVFTFRGVRRLTSQPGSMADNQQEPTNTTSITPSISAPNITNIADLKPHLSALLTTNPESALPDLAKVFGKVLTPEQFSQLIKEFESQQAATVVDKPEETAMVEQPTSGLKAEDISALKQQFELEVMDVPSASRATTDSDEQSANVPDKNEGQTTATPSVPSVQAKGDNNSSAAADKVSEVEGSSSESQQERFEKCEQYLDSKDRALILEGHDLLNALSVEGYPPAQYKFGTFMVHAGNAINIDGVINNGIHLIQAAAQQGYQLAIDHLSIHTFKRAQLNIPGIQNITDITGKEWKGNSHFKKQLKSALKKINDSGLKNDLTEAQNQQARDEGFKELQDLADLKDYAPAQYCLGCTQLVAGKYLNNAAFIQKGIMYLEKAAAQGVQQAVDLLARDPFTKDRSINKLSSVAQGLKEDITVTPLEAAKEVYRLGLSAELNGRYDEAFKYFLQAIESNNENAQYHLGMCYLQGKGVQPNTMLAAKYLELSANQGVLDAKHQLGILYFQGVGVEKSWSKAREFFEEVCRDKTETSIAPGIYKTCQAHLEVIRRGAVISYEAGMELLSHNTPVDNQLAVRQFRAAANLGHEDAQRVLNECLSFTAEGVETIGTCKFSPTVPEQVTVQAKAEPKASMPEDLKSSIPAKSTKAKESKTHKPSPPRKDDTLQFLTPEMRAPIIKEERGIVRAGPRSDKKADILTYTEHLEAFAYFVKTGYTTANRDDFFDKSYYQDGRSPQEHAEAFNRYAKDLKSKQSTQGLREQSKFAPRSEGPAVSKTEAGVKPAIAKKGK